MPGAGGDAEAKDFHACELQKLQPAINASHVAAHPWHRAPARTSQLISALNFANYMFL
jgi:hypothetical protein